MAGNIRDWTGLSGLSLGAGSGYSCGTPIWNISSITIPVVAITAAATKSTDTTYPFPGLAAGDHVLVSASTMSAQVALTGFCDTANTVTLRYSNVSSVAANVVANTVRATRIAF